MSPGSHLLFSWVSSVGFFRNRRERVLVSLSGISPDLDGLGIIVDVLSRRTSYFQEYHHYLGHNLLSALLFSTLACLLARVQKATIWLVSFAVIHLHYLCDIVGSKGPDGYQWPVYYFYPFNSYGFSWSKQWELNAWQNQVIMALLLAVSAYIAATKKITFLEVFSLRLQEEAFKMYRKYVRGA